MKDLHGLFRGLPGNTRNRSKIKVNFHFATFLIDRGVVAWIPLRSKKPLPEQFQEARPK
jgi:hypothetical protein